MSRQTHWFVKSPQAFDGLCHRHWKGDHPFFVPFSSFPDGQPLWVEAPCEVVRLLVEAFGAYVDLDCGSAGTGLYVAPISPWVEIKEEG